MDAEGVSVAMERVLCEIDGIDVEPDALARESFGLM